MIPEVTQKNLHLFIPFKVSKICALDARTRNIPITQSVAEFYRSDTSKKLEDESTKLWHEGWTGIYDLYMEELGKNDRGR